MSGSDIRLCHFDPPEKFLVSLREKSSSQNYEGVAENLFLVNKNFCSIQKNLKRGEGFPLLYFVFESD